MLEHLNESASLTPDPAEAKEVVQRLSSWRQGDFQVTNEKSIEGKLHAVRGMTQQGHFSEAEKQLIELRGQVNGLRYIAYWHLVAIKPQDLDSGFGRGGGWIRNKTVPALWGETQNPNGM